MMIKLLITLISVMMLSPLSAQEEKVKTQFSVTYMYNQKDSNDFEELNDLYFSYGKKNIPIPIKAFRQTILYPYLGTRKLSLFRLESKGDKEVRVPVVSTEIPVGAEKGALVIIRGAKGKLTIKPYWFRKGELRDGARFVNLWNGPMQLYVGKSKPKILKPQNYIDIVPELRKGEYKATLLNAFGIVERAEAKKTVRLIRDRNLTLTKGEPLLVINYQKSVTSSTMKCLRVKGHTGTVAYEELYKHLPDLRPKPNPRPDLGSGDGELNEWEKKKSADKPQSKDRAAG